MNTKMINANDELTLDQLDDVNGGFFAWLYAAAVDATFGDSCRKAADAMNGAVEKHQEASGVMADDNGNGCTDGQLPRF